MKLRVGLIGCGGIGRHHASRLVGQENITLAGVTDVRQESAATVGTEFGAPVFDSHEALLASPDIDAVWVCAPNFAHHELAVAACAAGKHVFCEKPMARTVRECDEMLAAAQRAGVKFMVGQVMRLILPFVRIREMVDSGEFGRPMLLDIARTGWGWWTGDWRARRELAYGVLHEVNVHEIDFMRSLCGDVAEVHGTVAKLIKTESEFEDTVLLTLRFQNGAIGLLRSIRCTTLGGSQGRVMCERGTIGYDWGKKQIEYRLADQQQPTSLTLDEAAFEDGFAREDRSFAEWVLFDRPPVFTGEEGRAAVEVAEAAYLSAERNAAVKLPM